MIPKIIHYCWFGRGDYPEKVRYCIESWKKFLPDYELRLWNEDTFDVKSSVFTEQAYAAKKYAFVSDYVRIYALKNCGGIYLDTDIEVLKSFNDLLDNSVVLGTDDVGELTAFMASCAEHPFFCDALQLYDNMSFLDENGKMNEQVNNLWLKDILRRYGYKQKNVSQKIKNGIVIYPCNFFHAKSLISGKLLVDEKTYCIHHHTLLWVSASTRITKFFRIRVLIPLIGEKKYIKFAEVLKEKFVK